MKREEVKPIIDAALPRMKTMTGLNDWDITIQYRKIKDTKHNKLSNLQTMGQCKTDGQGCWDKKAIIRLDPDKHDSIDKLILTLWHELGHCVTHIHLSPMRHALSEIISNANDLYCHENCRAAYKHIKAADEGLAQAIQKIAKSHLSDIQEQVAKCLKYGCSIETTTDICQVSTRFVEGIKSRMFCAEKKAVA